MRDDLISRQAAIDALCEAGLINYQATGDGNGMIHAINVIKGLPSAQPEPTFEQIKEYCRKRCLSIVDSELLSKYMFARQEEED